jgi:hypothetical protein
MSLNRENVIWKSKNGTWNIGFFDYFRTGDDHEWDVEYDFNSFNWCSTGHNTEREAHSAWKGANPGGTTIYREPSAETDQYDEMAAKLIEERKQRGCTDL